MCSGHAKHFPIFVCLFFSNMIFCCRRGRRTTTFFVLGPKILPDISWFFSWWRPCFYRNTITSPLFIPHFISFLFRQLIAYSPRGLSKQLCRFYWKKNWMSMRSGNTLASGYISEEFSFKPIRVRYMKMKRSNERIVLVLLQTQQ